MRLDLATNNRGLGPDGIECGTISHLEILIGVSTVTLERSIKNGRESDPLSGVIVSFHSVDIHNGVNFIVNRHASLVGKAVKAYKLVVRVDSTIPEEAHYDVSTWHQGSPESDRDPVAEGPVS